MYSQKPVVGVGLRSTHYPHLEANGPIRIDWFEALSENYMDTEGRPLQMLLHVRSRHQVGLHGVSLSIGSAGGIDLTYLKRLNSLVDRVQPFIVSDHLCWSRTADTSTHDLMPLPFTDETLETVIRNADLVQETLKRQILLENVSSYLRFEGDEYNEWDFLVRVARKSGCKILLDINNVFVSARNHGFDPKTYLDAIPSNLIGQIHLAGHTDCGTHLFDTHSTHVCEDVWSLLTHIAPRVQGVPLLVEWDEDIPAFEVVEDEALKAGRLIKEASIESR